MNYKKGYILLVLALTLSMILSACNQKATSEDGKVDDSSLTLQEVWEKTIAANEAISSLSMKMDSEQVITLPEQEEPQNISSTINMDVVQEPIAFYQEMSFNIPGEKPLKAESYFTEQGFFTFDPTTESWVKLPDILTTDLLESAKKQGNPIEEFKKLQSFVDDMKFEQNDASYLLSLHASGDKFQSLVEDEISAVNPELLEGLEDLNISNLDFTYTIDKETFQLTAMKISMNIEIADGEEKVAMKQTSHATFENYNNVGEISIPKEILESAEEVSLP